MRRELHVRFCESPGVQSPRATRLIILIAAPTGHDQFERARDAAIKEKEEVAAFLKRELGLELSETKTLVTPVTEPMRFLGHHVRVRRHPVNGNMVVATLIPKDVGHRLREKVKALFKRHTTADSLANRLRQLNPLLRGWSNFYRHAWGAKQVFSSFDSHVWWTIARWLRKKHRRSNWAEIARRYGWRGPRGGLNWQDEAIRPFVMAHRRVEPFRLSWLKTPGFASNTRGEPDA